MLRAEGAGGAYAGRPADADTAVREGRVARTSLGQFRLGHGAVPERLPVAGLAALLEARVARPGRMARDGMRRRAPLGRVRRPVP